MRKRIWLEYTQAKHNLEFIVLFAHRQRRILRIFNILILAFSSAGVMGWKVWDVLPVVACAIIALVSLLRLIKHQLIMKEKQIKDLDEIQQFYTQYFTKLECLWYDLESEKISEKRVANKFYRIKKSEESVNRIIAESLRSKPKKLVLIAKENSDNYFKQLYS